MSDKLDKTSSEDSTSQEALEGLNSSRSMYRSSRKLKVLALSTGQALTGVVTLAVAAVLARVLSKAEFATFQQTFLAYQFVAPFLLLGLPQAIYYFLPQEKKRIRGRIIDGLLIVLFISVVFSFFLGLGGNRLLAWRFNNPNLAETLKYLIPYPFFMLPMGLVASVLVVHERVALLSIYNVTSRLLIGLAVIIPVLFWETAAVSIIGQVAMTIPMAVVAIYLMLKVSPIGSLRPKLDSMAEMVRYSVPLGLASMIGVITLQLDKVIVASMSNPEDFAVYANGAIEIPLIGIITGSITAVVLADMRKSVVVGNVNEAVRLFRKTAEMSSYLLFPVMLFLLVCGDLFVQVLFSDAYLDSVIPFRVYLLILPIRTVVFGSLMMALGQSRQILNRTVFELIFNLCLSLFLVNLVGPVGAAIGTLVTVYLVSVPYSLYMISRDTKIRWTELLPFTNFRNSLGFLILPSISVFMIRIFVSETEMSPFNELVVLGIFFFSITFLWWNKNFGIYEKIKSII